MEGTHQICGQAKPLTQWLPVKGHLGTLAPGNIWQCLEMVAMIGEWEEAAGISGRRPGLLLPQPIVDKTAPRAENDPTQMSRVPRLRSPVLI